MPLLMRRMALKIPVGRLVKVSIDGQDIEIPHLSLASSVAFPNEVFGFSYMYNQADKPISSVTIDLGDSLRRVSVSGESADKVEALSKLLEKDFRRYATAAGGVKFRRVAGICLSMLFLTSLMIGSAYYWNNRNRTALGIPICSAVGFLLVLLVPWNRFLPGFVLYQRYSPFFLIRHAPQIFVLCRCRRSFRNSIILFSFTKAAVAILLVSGRRLLVHQPRCCSRLPVASVSRLNCFDPSNVVIGSARQSAPGRRTTRSAPPSRRISIAVNRGNARARTSAPAAPANSPESTRPVQW